MEQITEQKRDGWTKVNIRNYLVDKLEQFVKQNPVFDNPSQVVEFAVKNLLEKSDK